MFTALLGLASLALLVPALVLLIECLAASHRVDAPRARHPRPRLAVLIPAHDEGAVIPRTLDQVRAQLYPDDRLLVVADNCSDDTAALARRAGAEVIERRDAERRGKGFALAFGLKHLSARPPEVVLVVDADCEVAAGTIDRLARQASASGRPVQAEYVLTQSPNGAADARGAISALAFLVRNQVRMRGLHRMGQPCQLTGSGMAFPWALLRDAPPLRDNLVEDMVLGVHLALAGKPPLHCAQASITSPLPRDGRAQWGQRRRWEHGHLTTLLTYGPRLLTAGLRRRRIDLCAMALDIMVPPLALLVVAMVGLLPVTGGAWALGASALPFLINLLSLGLVTVAVACAWWRFARHTVPAHALAAVPAYVLWKIPLYLGFALRGRHKTWERTARASAEEERAA